MFLMALPLAVSSAFALAPEVDAAEAQCSAGQLDLCLAALEAYLQTHPDDPEALWRLARGLYEKGEMLAQSVPDSQRLPVYERVREISQRAQVLDPENGQGYLWEGVALGRIGTTKGVLASLFLADDVEDLWLEALTKPTKYRMASGISSFPGDVYNGLGQLYRLVPDWKAIEWIAGTRGDIDKSVHYFKLMVDDDPNRLEGLKELGVALLCKGYKQGDNSAKAEGRMWLNKAYTLPASYPTDKIDHNHIPIILQRESEACGYSRDGWEDVSKEAYVEK